MVASNFKRPWSNPQQNSCMGKVPPSNKKNLKLLHPKQQANCMSNLFFCWTFPTIIKSFINGFKESEIFGTLPSQLSSTLGDRLEQEWLKEKDSKQPSLWKTLRKIFAVDFILLGLYVFVLEFLVKLSQPILISQLIKTQVVHSSQQDEAYIYASFLVLSSFTEVVMSNWYGYKMRILALKVRIGCSSLIYRKALKLNKNGFNKASTATGRIVNLLANDLYRFDYLFVPIHYLWAAPLETVVIFYVLYVLLGVTATVGIALFYLFVPFQVLLGTAYLKFRFQGVKKTDKRVNFMTELVSAIQVIKMYTWESFFIKIVNKIRKEEMHYIRVTSYLKCFLGTISKFLNKGAVFSCIILLVLSGYHVQSQYVFVIKSFYNLLKICMCDQLPEAIKNVGEAAIAVQRVEEYLLSKEFESKTKPPTGPCAVYLKGASARWASSVVDNLSNMDFMASKKQLTSIVGSVGSGKTSLINVLLQELSLSKGSLSINGTISYAAQEACLFAGTIKENILFGQSLDKTRYNEVVEVCALGRDFNILPYGDHSVIGEKGVTLSGGQRARISLARAVYKKADIYILDDPLSAVDASVGKQLFEQCILGYLKDECVILATHQLQFLKKSDCIYLMKNGSVAAKGDFETIRQCGEDFARLLYKEVECEDNFDDSAENSTYEGQEEKKLVEARNCGTIPWKVYREYLFAGGWFVFLLIMLLFIVSQCANSGSDYFESYWVSLEEQRIVNQTNNFISVDNSLYIYTGITSFYFLISMLTNLSYITYFLNVATKLHKESFFAIVKTSLSFFHKNPSGNIINRFSKDIDFADNKLPKYLLDTIQQGLQILSIFTLVAIVNPWMLINTTVLLALFYFVRKLYISTSRELKRLEAISRSPIYSQLNETLNGLETIRAFEIEEKQKLKFHLLLDKHTSAFFMLITLAQTFSLWLGVFATLYLTFVVTSAFWNKDIYGASLGLMVTQAISLAQVLHWGMMQWSEFENEMTSVERILEYKNSKPEEESDEKSAEWPDTNSIEFKEVTLTYKKNIPAALNKLSFSVAPNEKIGIVGRTGAGKTSIISALFRLVKCEGTISIGGVNFKDMPLEKLRSNISIIPQDPVLFSGTVRENLDPYKRITDHDIWSLLNDLDLTNLVNQMPAGLESAILAKGANLSVGQRQLLCLCRALLRKNKILVLDEATASVDYETDSLVQNTIKKKLKKCTVLIIAHRLHTVMDCDKVLVMDEGQALEFDHPHKLLQNPEGALHQLVLNTGPSMTVHLKELAKKSYDERTPSF